MTSSVDVLLARFPWPSGDAADGLRRIGGDRAAAPRVFRAIDRDEGYAYLPAPDGASVTSLADTLSSVLPGAIVVRLERMSDIAGASAGEEAPFHYVVETDVRAEQEDDFNAWYEREHLPGLAAVDGTVRAMRFRDRDGHPRYFACYDLARAEALGSPAWLAVRGTAWSSRVRPAFFNTRRTMFRRD